MKWILSLLLCAAAAAAALGQSYYNGYISPAGYAYRDGLWYLNGKAYTRSWATEPGYWSCGRYYPGTGYWAYSEHYVAPAAALPKYDDPNAIEELLRIANKSIKDQQQIQNYAFAVKALGLENRIPVQAQVPYTTYGHFYQHYGASANTIYGAAPVTYGQTDLNQLNLLAAQLAQSGMDAGKAFNQGFQQLVSDQSQNAAKIAEINARRDFAIAMMQSLVSDPNLKAQGISFKITPELGFQPQIDQIPAAQVQQLKAEFAATKQRLCGECHSGAKKAGGWDVASFSALNQQERERIIMERLTTQDENKRMPRTKEGKAGPRVQGRDLLLFQMNP